jgi:hypothetical protein
MGCLQLSHQPISRANTKRACLEYLVHDCLQCFVVDCLYFLVIFVLAHMLAKQSMQRLPTANTRPSTKTAWRLQYLPQARVLLMLRTVIARASACDFWGEYVVGLPLTILTRIAGLALVILELLLNGASAFVTYTAIAPSKFAKHLKA